MRGILVCSVALLLLPPAAFAASAQPKTYLLMQIVSSEQADSLPSNCRIVPQPFPQRILSASMLAGCFFRLEQGAAVARGAIAGPEVMGIGIVGAVAILAGLRYSADHARDTANYPRGLQQLEDYANIVRLGALFLLAHFFVPDKSIAPSSVAAEAEKGISAESDTISGTAAPQVDIDAKARELRERMKAHPEVYQGQEGNLRGQLDSAGTAEELAQVEERMTAAEKLSQQPGLEKGDLRRKMIAWALNGPQAAVHEFVAGVQRLRSGREAKDATTWLNDTRWDLDKTGLRRSAGNLRDSRANSGRR